MTNKEPKHAKLPSPEITRAREPIHPMQTLQQQVGNQSVQRLLESGELQTKLQIGQQDDIYEQEADRVAKNVMRAPVRALKRRTELTADVAVAPVPHDFLQDLGPGEPLSADARALFELRFGSDSNSGQTAETAEPVVGIASRSRDEDSVQAFDFSQVRVHENQRAAESAQTLGALAYTVGSHVVFAPGQYAPTTTEGQQLLAHELAHIMQQSGRGNHPSPSPEGRRLAMQSKGDPLVNHWRQAILQQDYGSALNALRQMNQPSQKFLLGNQSFITAEILTGLSDAAAQSGPEFAEVLTIIQEEKRKRESAMSESESRGSKSESANRLTIKSNQISMFGRIEGSRLSCNVGSSKGDCPLPSGPEIMVLERYRGGSWLLVRFHNEKLASEWNGREGIVQVFIRKADLDADQKAERTEPEEVINVELVGTEQDPWGMRELEAYVDKRCNAVGLGLYLGGYLLYCSGIDKPIFVPDSYVDLSLTKASITDTHAYGTRDEALTALIGHAGSYAAYHAVEGLIAPTVFSPASTPRIARMIRSGWKELVAEVNYELTTVAISIVGGMAFNALVNRLFRWAEGIGKPIPGRPKTTPEIEPEPLKGPTEERAPPSRLGARFAALRERAAALIEKVMSEVGEVIVNLGGLGPRASRRDPKGAINVNNLSSSTVRNPEETIENFINANAEEIGEIFPQNSVDKIISYNVEPSRIDWKATANGARAILKPGGSISVGQLGGTEADIIAEALRAEGFTITAGPEGGFVTAVKPAQ